MLAPRNLCMMRRRDNRVGTNPALMPQGGVNGRGGLGVKVRWGHIFIDKM